MLFFITCANNEFFKSIFIKNIYNMNYYWISSNFNIGFGIVLVYSPSLDPYPPANNTISGYL